MSNHRQYLITEEVKRLQAKLGDKPTTKERVDRPIAKAFILDGAFMRNGERWEPTAKAIGLGVFDVGVKPAEAGTP
jgi:hypothetical protein